ncbi:MULTISPECIES: hypothetical protein [unclassified Stenotrophomonas]|jgi:hypothetical protein|uniref:hypothetical protein n=1 Tax=Stenotrophomonas sp. MA5 TaxID=2508572 RepID=UPI00066BAAC3|nr:hypothetical protein [Stenotrophomonas sp. MA5]MBN5136905.1 hypothetical protein [Stenotrophomonas maltophilia]RXK69832.1 hypothetical protein ERT44_02775 [Stenotrophomonas sp. MA5]
MSAHKKSPLSKEQWAEVEKALATPYGGDVELIADEHRLVIQVRQIKTLRYAVIVFVDGEIKQGYMQESSPIGAKFYRPRKFCLYSRAQQARMVKSLGKRRTATMVKQGTGTIYDPGWPSAAALRRHLSRTCTSIELIRAGWSARVPEGHL